MASAYLVLEKLRIQFGDEVLLESVDLEIARGEKVVLVGPSGHGKSVLLKTMGGILPPTSGKVFVEGEDLYAINPHKRQKLMLKMGMLFQKNALFDSLSVSENIAFPLREITSLSESEIQKKIDFFLEEVGLTASKALFPDEISGGMQKRLGIARALALDPELIFYDDPTAGLDPITSRKIIDLILMLQQQKKSTLVAITNEMPRAYQLADRIAMVVDKELIVTGNKEQTLACREKRVHQFVRGETSGPLTVSA